MVNMKWDKKRRAYFTQTKYDKLVKVFGHSTSLRRAIALVITVWVLAIGTSAFTATQLDLTTQVKGTLPIANGGTGATAATGSGNLVLATSPTITTPGFSGDITTQFGLGSQALGTTILNDTTTGTTVNLLAKLSATSKLIITGTGDTSGIVGVVVSGAGTTGSAVVAVHGQVGCIADNSITQDDYIVEGTTTAGRCKSAGSTPPVGNQVIGRSLTTTSAASTATILLYGPNIQDTAAGVNFADDETPSGTINGSNTTFTLAHTPNPAGSLALFKNGQKLEPGGVDYTLTTNSISTVVAPKTGDVLTTATYRF